MGHVNGMEVGGIPVVNFVLAIVIMVVFIYVVYYVSTCPFKAEKFPSRVNEAMVKYDMEPGDRVAKMYAMGLEPGTVVLQGEDGEFFRVIEETEQVEINMEPAEVPITQEAGQEPQHAQASYETRVEAPQFQADYYLVPGSGSCGDGQAWQSMTDPGLVAY